MPAGLTLHEGWGVLRLGEGRSVPILDAAALDALGEALESARRDRAAALVISGGTSIFAAGADLNEVARLTPLAAWAFSRRGQALFDALERFPGVTLAAVAGRCIGGALDLVLACDLRVAGSGARFEHPGPRLGFITGYGGTTRLPRMAGSAARSALLGLESIDAALAARSGLVTHTTEDPDPLPAATALARAIAAGGERARRRAMAVKAQLALSGAGARPLPLLRRMQDLRDAAGG